MGNPIAYSELVPRGLEVIPTQPEDAEIEFRAKEDSRQLVPEGLYLVTFLKAKIVKFFNGKKLYAVFEIADGAYVGTRLFRAYNYYESALPVGSDLFKDFEFLYGKKLRKNTKLSTSLFRHKILEVSVRTVKENRVQKALAEHQQYSVIDRIVRIAAGGHGATNV